MTDLKKPKELTVISGKGGTGKTSITAAFAAVAQSAVLADCDVDAADLHLILKPDIIDTIPFTGLKIAIRDEETCTGCGLCRDNCRFEVFSQDLTMRPDRCEGCGVCAHVCPVDAIEMADRSAGEAYMSNTRFGPMSHARLFAAQEGSGMLVSLVRKNALALAKEHDRDLVIVDGPPGTGCPVISAITGADLVLVVTEPTVSGAHDLHRVLEVADHFEIPRSVCINKSDINTLKTREIDEFCKRSDIPLVGVLPYDNDFTRAMIEEKSIIEHGDCSASRAVREMFSKITEMLG